MRKFILIIFLFIIYKFLIISNNFEKFGISGIIPDINPMTFKKNELDINIKPIEYDNKKIQQIAKWISKLKWIPSDNDKFTYVHIKSQGIYKLSQSKYVVPFKKIYWNESGISKNNKARDVYLIIIENNGISMIFKENNIPLTKIVSFDGVKIATVDDFSSSNDKNISYSEGDTIRWDFFTLHNRKRMTPYEGIITWKREVKFDNLLDKISYWLTTTKWVIENDDKINIVSNEKNNFPSVQTSLTQKRDFNTKKIEGTPNIIKKYSTNNKINFDKVIHKPKYYIIKEKGKMSYKGYTILKMLMTNNYNDDIITFIITEDLNIILFRGDVYNNKELQNIDLNNVQSFLNYFGDGNIIPYLQNMKNSIQSNLVSMPNIIISELDKIRISEMIKNKDNITETGIKANNNRVDRYGYIDKILVRK